MHLNEYAHTKTDNFFFFSPPNSFSTPGYVRTANMTECRPCPAGTFEDGQRLECLPCPAGTYSSVLGAYNNFTSDPPILACLECPVLQTSFGGDTQCLTCDSLDFGRGMFPIGGGPNTYAKNSTVRGLYHFSYPSSKLVHIPPSPLSFLDQTCASCPDHLFTNGTLNATSIACVRCPAGHFRFSGNMSTCEPALPGWYMDENSGAENVGSNSFVVTEADGVHRRSLLFLVQNMRRHALEEENNGNTTAAESSFPVPPKLLACQPGMSCGSVLCGRCWSLLSFVPLIIVFPLDFPSQTKKRNVQPQVGLCDLSLLSSGFVSAQ